MTSHMSKIIGTPPYQQMTKGVGTRDTASYNPFMDAAPWSCTHAVRPTPAPL